MSERRIIKINKEYRLVFRDPNLALLVGQVVAHHGVTIHPNANPEVHTNPHTTSYFNKQQIWVMGLYPGGYQWIGGHESITTDAIDIHTLREFTDRFIPEERAILISEGISGKFHQVGFQKGKITVGCTTITNDVVREIADRLED